MNTESLTAKICTGIVAAKAAAEANTTLREKARQLFLDGIAVAVAGARLEPAPRILAAHFLDPLCGGGGNAHSTCTLLGQAERLPAIQAASVNAAAMHVLDFEPMWLPATHALSPALAPALALGEALGAPGAKILTAMILGIEIQGWLRHAAGALQSHELRFHPPGVVGPIGAAVAAGILLDFDAGQFANAIGVASSRCGSLFSNLGTMTKSSHLAYAASLGLEAALLTHRGFTGFKATFDSTPQSYSEAFYPRGFDGESLLNLGVTWRILDPGYTTKIFPAKFSTHYGITAALAARPQIPDAEAIRSVHIIAADVPSSDRPKPASGLDGKFSLQYTAAAALLDGQIGFASFTDDRLQRRDMQALLPKFSVTLSRDISSKYTEGRYLDLIVTLADGSIVRERCERPRGAWGAEPISEPELVAKARDCLALCLAPRDVDACIDLAQDIEQLDATGLRTLLKLTSGTREAVPA